MSESTTQVATAQRHAPDWLILSIACIAQFMVVLDVSIVNVALPRMGHDLHFSYSSAQWVVNAYVLTFAGFLLLGGRAADYFGRRHVYLAGIFLFTVASMFAGFAQTGPQMVAIRAVQGIGGAILSPATLTIIVTTFHGPRLPKAIGAWSAVAGAGGAVGGLLGGVLTPSARYSTERMYSARSACGDGRRSVTPSSPGDRQMPLAAWSAAWTSRRNWSARRPSDSLRWTRARPVPSARISAQSNVTAMPISTVPAVITTIISTSV